jgi:glycosyltransferase involved in cell wall biosynthesis
MLSAAVLGFAHLRRVKPDVVLAFFGAPSGVAAWLWSFVVRTPYIVSLRGGDVPGFRPYDFARQHKVLAPLLRQVWRHSAAVVANSKGLRELAVKFDAKKEITIIPNGVNLERFHVPTRAWSPPSLLFVGRVVYQKGLDLLLNALGEIKDLPWALNIVGDGPRVERLREQAIELGIGERVHFLGWQTRAQLPATYACANIFVNPSRHEGMPNALLEAMASGLPALATRIAGNEELITEQTGLLVPAEDTQALREALRKLLSDETLRARLGAAAHKRVAGEYSWRRVAQAYLDLMTNITANK